MNFLRQTISIFSVLLSVFLISSNALIQQQNSVLTSSDIEKVSKGGVAVIHDFISPSLITRLRQDAQQLFEDGNFQPDGLTNTARSKSEQGFTVKADRQTFRGGADWETQDVGDWKARKEFLDQMTALRNELATTLVPPRPTLQKDGVRRHEMTYNWYEPGAKLGRHLDEHHEETKGFKGWLLPTRRSVTWLVYLNKNWEDHEGGALRTFPRKDTPSSIVVGAHEGNLQVGWLNDVEPVYLDCFRESGQSALYRIITGEGDSNNIRREVLTKYDFDVPRQPIEFVKFLPEKYQGQFEQISTARLDPRFAAPSNAKKEEECEAARSLLADKNETYYFDILPKAGTLVLFDSVTLPHLVQEVTSKRQRIAATGWFHEDSQFFLGQEEQV